jgi:hypothetical protein
VPDHVGLGIPWPTWQLVQALFAGQLSAAAWDAGSARWSMLRQILVVLSFATA